MQSEHSYGQRGFALQPGASITETVKVSKKYQVVIPKKLREEAGIRVGDRMVAILKNNILQYVPVRPLRDTKGMIRGLDTRDLRDEMDRMWT